MPEQPEPDAVSILIDRIFMVLPAASISDIAKKLTVEGFNTVPKSVYRAVAHLRKNAFIYGWTIPHVKQGKPGSGREKERFYAVLVDEAFGFEIDLDKKDNLKEGTLSNIKRITQQSANAVVYLQLAAEHCPLPGISEWFLYLASHYRRIVSLGKRLIRQIESL
jgi:hypothetical protein